MYKLLFPTLIILGILACTPKVSAPLTKETPVQPTEVQIWDSIGKPSMGTEPMEEYTLDDLVVNGQRQNMDSLPIYRAAATRYFDLLHTSLDVRFDWAKRRVLGEAVLTLQPYFYTQNRVELDAKNFDIHSVVLENGSNAPLKYDYNGEKLWVNLDRTYKKGENIKLRIKYTAKPDERETVGGSAAITSDKGLFFINPDGAVPDKPKQIWTQGETESSSRWFPTIDKPNERCTQDINITVEDKYKTLSNGIMVNSRKNADGTRTDTYKMDKPHAPYLFMLTVGEFAVVKEKWRNIDVEYYVEKKYENYAKDIFPYTPEMLEFFSTKLNYNYPWSKFSQVVVRDYVSGAMENTTAVIFGEFMHGTSRELLDNNKLNEKIVAHEMFHHWFGDLVTTESWSNLTLNEGFANYSEYLWLEHKHGKDVAEQLRMEEIEGYKNGNPDGGRPLIHYRYEDKESMFDAISYNKGGAILHMLRNYVGDEAFFAALNLYLKRNEYTEVEADELRLAFEEVTGEDLNWFFNQWFLGAGHPQLEINYDYNATTKTASVTVEQHQPGTPTVAHIFNIPLEIDLYDAAGNVRKEKVRITQRKQTFSWEVATKPALINFDAQKTLICDKQDNHTPEEWAFMYKNGKEFLDRHEALTHLTPEEGAEVTDKEVFQKALSDKSPVIKKIALQYVDSKNAETLKLVEKIAATENEPSVRAMALEVLAEKADNAYLPIFQVNMTEKQPFSVVGAALSGLSKLNPQEAAKACKSLEKEDADALVLKIAHIYAQAPNVENLAYMKEKSKKIDQMGAFQFFEDYQQFIYALKDPAKLDEAVQSWKATASDLVNESQWRRFSSTKAIADIRNSIRKDGDAALKAKDAEYTKILDAIKSNETDQTLLMYYQMF